MGTKAFFFRTFIGILCDELDIDTMHLFYKEALLSLSLQRKGRAHPNVVKFLGVAINPPELCLIYEYCKHKSLTNVLQNIHIYPNINYIQILYIAEDIAKGMKFLHQHNIVHRDLVKEIYAQILKSVLLTNFIILPLF